ncbi:SCO0930 family lipoprotein [Streptomyces sp. NPDC088354]|uniref:SCO0930 family lipoprotein n=1 Tax=unclassified Streptomyces TaxID=2593676 RepID=UPI0029A77BA5|nr:SCO0930 family lipoprotein [Streptomyces sp. MI02-7b]MDX3075964.1 SCO0930 family lipoprotein [Streptomyces sp. MI02-7b]
MNKNARNALFLTGTALALTAVTACGQQTGTGAAPASVQQPVVNAVSGYPSVDDTESAPPVTEAASGLAVRTDAKLKTIVVDGKGMTVYVFSKDTKPGTSSCEGECAAQWPPVPADDAQAAKGLNQDLLGSITRTDGSKQLTLAGKPLYYFAKDSLPGDTNGQGVKGLWYAAEPDGWKAGVERPALGVLNDPKLGKILQDKNGRTLYLFTKDKPWPMKTACDATCLQKWTPTAPVTAADAKAAGLAPTALFTFNTPNGTQQEAFNCWPGYTFKGDSQPGDTNGQNVKGVWFAIKQDITVDRGKTVPAAKG